MGLIMGNALGANLHAIIEASAPELKALWYDMSSVREYGVTALYLTRYVIGLVVVLTARSVAKKVSESQISAEPSWISRIGLMGR